MRKIDYTKMRLGTITRQWTYRGKVYCRKIAKCPICGRKGEKSTEFAGKLNEHDAYKHISDVSEVIPGFPIEHVRERCTTASKENINDQA